MGQYHKVVNLTKKQYIHPHGIDNGLKLYEQVGFMKSSSTALFALLACSSGRGGGDFPDHPLIGTWAGCEIAVIGDYAGPEDMAVLGFDAEEIYSKLGDEYEDISKQVVALLTLIDK